MRTLAQTTGALLLVNAAHSMATSASPDLVCVDPRWPGVQLEPRRDKPPSCPGRGQEYSDFRHRDHGRGDSDSALPHR